MACAASVSGLDANWAPRTATRAGPANANVTLAQAKRCDLIAKRAPKPRQADDQSRGVVRTDRELTYPTLMAAISMGSCRPAQQGEPTGTRRSLRGVAVPMGSCSLDVRI